jgi:hypothetical protein
MVRFVDPQAIVDEELGRVAGEFGAQVAALEREVDEAVGWQARRAAKWRLRAVKRRYRAARRRAWAILGAPANW